MHSAAWIGDNIDHPPPGVILIWDPIYSVFNANPKAVMKLDRIRAAGWKLDFNAQFVSGVSSFFPDPDFSKQWHIFLSPNSAKAHAMTATASHESPSHRSGTSSLDRSARTAGMGIFPTPARGLGIGYASSRRSLAGRAMRNNGRSNKVARSNIG